MIDQSRFLVQSADRDEWLRVRATGVTATMVGKAHDDKGFAEIVGQMADPTPIPDNAFMAFGRDQESNIIDRLAERFDIAGNDWLISSAEEHWMMATPDGLSPDHRMIVEVKTTDATGARTTGCRCTTNDRSSGSCSSPAPKNAFSRGCYEKRHPMVPLFRPGSDRNMSR